MAVVDSSALINLVRIGRLDLLKRYFGKIKITKNIYEEISTGKTGVSGFKDACEDWIIIKESENLKSIDKISGMEGIEKADTSVILLAKEINEILIANDYALIIVAKSKNIKCWWLTTFLLNCLKKKIITKNETKQILFDLIKSGMRLNNIVYTEILREIDLM